MKKNCFFTRNEPTDSLDFYPTPPWATRALFSVYRFNPEHTVLEPACGKGHMSQVLKEHFKNVDSSDIHPYGYGDVGNFLRTDYLQYYDWVITNPPFNQILPFIKQAKRITIHGIAIFARIQFLEGRERYNDLFFDFPPTIVAQFVQRVGLQKNRVDPKSTSTVPYAWFIWDKKALQKKKTDPIIKWIPPCQEQFTRQGDYNEDFTICNN